MSKYPSSAFIGVFLITLPLGCAQPTGNSDEAAAIAAIQKFGGKVELEGQGNDRRVIKVYLHGSSIQDDDLTLIEKLPKVRNLFLGKTQVRDAGLSYLRTSSELQTLSLNYTRVTDEGLKSLTGLSKLKTLNLQETKATAEGAAELRKAIPGLTIAQ